MAREIKRHGFYDDLNKEWILYHETKGGKIKIDKKTKTKSELQKFIKVKNYKKQDTWIETKKTSMDFIDILPKKKIQTKVDRLLEKKKLTAIEKEHLKQATNY